MPPETAAREGLLERRGPGIIGKWETKWFRAVGGVLDCFAADEAGARGPVESSITLRDVSELTLEADKRECTFIQADGTKVRVRAKSEAEVHAWFASLQAGQAWEEPPKEKVLFDKLWPAMNEQLETPSTTPRSGPRKAGAQRISPRAAEETNQSMATSDLPPHTPSSMPGRIHQLHALHEAKQRRLESQRHRLEAEEMARIAAERDALRQGTRGNLDPASLNPHEAAHRLFQHHKEAEQRLVRLQLKLEEEERQRLQERRFKKNAGAKTPAAEVPGGAAGVRLYEEYKRREQEKQAKKTDEVPTPERSLAKSTATAGGNHYHDKLYDDAQHRREQLDKKQRERDAAEAKKMADEAIFQRAGPVDMTCLVKLHGDYEQKLKKQALRMAQKQEKERLELEGAMRWMPCRPPSSPQDPIWLRPSKSAYYLGAGEGRAHSPTKRSSPDLATPVDVTIAALAHTVQLRCADPHSTDAKALAPPLRALLGLFGDAQAVCEKGDGYPALCVRASQRLFRDCCLVPEYEGFEQCREPNPIHQVQDGLTELLETAQRVQLQLQELFVPSGGARWAPGTTHTGLAHAQQALFAYSSGPKTRAAAELKARALFQPAEGARRYRHLLDLARITLVFPSCDLLHAGLDEIVGKFEVVRVTNRFASPSRLGARHVEVLLVISVEVEEGVAAIPHVCEVRLEEVSFHQAQQLAIPQWEEFDKVFRVAFFRANRDMDALAYIARCALAAAPESHNVRLFRRHISQSFVSPAVAWRRLGCTRLISFDRFRDLCNSLKCREFAPTLWCTLDQGFGGCISLFEIAPEAVTLLSRLRAHMLALEQTDDPDEHAFLERLTVGGTQGEGVGRAAAHEFTNMLRTFGFGSEDINRIFKHLDYQAANSVKPSTGTNVVDVAWLRRLNTIVDTEAVLLTAKTAPSDFDALRHIARMTPKTRSRRYGAVPGLKRNSKFALVSPERPRTSRGEAPSSGSARSPRRSKSSEPRQSTSASSTAELPASAGSTARVRTTPPTKRVKDGSNAEADGDEAASADDEPTQEVPVRRSLGTTVAATSPRNSVERKPEEAVVSDARHGGDKQREVEEEPSPVAVFEGDPPQGEEQYEEAQDSEAQHREHQLPIQAEEEEEEEAEDDDYNASGNEYDGQGHLGERMGSVAGVDSYVEECF